MKKFMAICLAVLLVVCLTACGGAKTPEEVLSATTKTMSELDSFSFGMEMNMTMQTQGVEVPMTLAVTGESTREPQVVHANMNLDMMIMAFNLEMYSETVDSEVTSYVGIDLGNGMQWGQQKAEGIPDFSTNTADTLALLTGLTEAEETETVNGVEATRYEGVITGEDIKTAVDAMGMMNSMGETMEGIGDVGAMFEGLEPDAQLPVVYLIDKENSHLLEVRMDMTDMISSMLEGMLPEEAGDVLFTKLSITASYGDFNTVEPIVIPEAARMAPEG